MIVLALLGAWAGGAFAARRAGGTPWLGGLLLAASPALRGSLASGLTEDLGLGLAAVALALILHPFEAEPHGLRRRLPWILGLGFALGGLALSAPYLAWASALLALGFGLADVARQPRRLVPWAHAALLALFLAAPTLAAQGERLWSGLGHHAGLRAETFEPLWRLSPWGGADLVAFLVPGPLRPPADFIGRLHPVYLGLSVLPLAMLGRSRPWALTLLLALLVAPGATLRILGHPTGFPNPFAQLLHLLPFGDLVNHHARLLLIGQVALAVLAARGLSRVPRWTRRLLPALLAVDYVLLSPLPLPLPVAHARCPDFLSRMEALPPGILCLLPLPGPGVHPQRALLDQRVHKRPLALNPNIPGPPRGLEGTATALHLGALRPGDPPPAGPPDPCLMTRRSITVLGASTEVREGVAAWFGRPDVSGEDGAAWDLTRLCKAEESTR
jgi:hypothetical protein